MAKIALNRIYGIDFPWRGPGVAGITWMDTACIVHYKHAGKSLVVDGSPLRGFKISGKEGKFIRAHAELEGTSSVRVWHESIREPAAVRFAFEGFSDANLYNSDGFPAEPFRSDSFNLVFDQLALIDNEPGEMLKNSSVKRVKWQYHAESEAWMHIRCTRLMTNGFYTGEMTGEAFEIDFSRRPVVFFRITGIRDCLNIQILLTNHENRNFPIFSVHTAEIDHVPWRTESRICENFLKYNGTQAPSGKTQMRLRVKLTAIKGGEVSIQETGVYHRLDSCLPQTAD